MQGILKWWLASLLAGSFVFSAGAESKSVIRLATTTSTATSGLLDYLLPNFEAECTCAVHVIAVGSGKALKLAEDGNVDLVMVHARSAEDAFVAARHGVDRKDVMYNDFIIVGPKQDPAQIRGQRDVLAAMKQIADGQFKFVSRGDNSGTAQMEKSYWKKLDLQAEGRPWYYSAGQGMGEVLMMSNEMGAYTLCDRGTYNAYQSKIDLSILMQGDPKMFNPYGIIAVNPEKYPDINYEGASRLIEWITSTKAQKLIGNFKVNGKQLFTPSAQ